MNDFKAGDVVWYMSSECNADIMPCEIYLKKSIINSVSKRFLVIENRFKTSIGPQKAYKSKKKCLDAFRKRLDDLEEVGQ